MSHLMQFGVCTTIENSARLKKAGWDFIETRVQVVVRSDLNDAQWADYASQLQPALPIRAVNTLLPETLKITGPSADIELLRNYFGTLIPRAAKVGVQTLVFGSRPSRHVPDGFDHPTARRQIISFLRMIAPMLQKHGVTLVVEHLNAAKTNIITSVEEAMTYVRELNHPNIRNLLDTYHFWCNKEAMSTVAPALCATTHLHVANVDRTVPGLDPSADYRAFFSIFKRGGYDRTICVEADWPDLDETAETVLQFIKREWELA